VQGSCPARSRATLRMHNVRDVNPEGIAQNAPRVSEDEGIFEVAIATSGIDVLQNPYRVPSSARRPAQGCPTFVGQPWSALRNAFSVESARRAWRGSAMADEDVSVNPSDPPLAPPYEWGEDVAPGSVAAWGSGCATPERATSPWSGRRFSAFPFFADRFSRCRPPRRTGAVAVHCLQMLDPAVQPAISFHEFVSNSPDFVHDHVRAHESRLLNDTAFDERDGKPARVASDRQICQPSNEAQAIGLAKEPAGRKLVLRGCGDPDRNSRAPRATIHVSSTVGPSQRRQRRCTSNKK
jgi:hypothetical protein